MSIVLACDCPSFCGGDCGVVGCGAVVAGDGDRLPGDGGEVGVDFVKLVGAEGAVCKCY